MRKMEDEILTINGYETWRGKLEFWRSTLSDGRRQV
jgi:hypothetical protein